MQKRRSTAAARVPDPPVTPRPGPPRAAKRSATHRPTYDVVGALYAEHQYVARLLEILEHQISAAAHAKPLDREASIAVMSYMTEYPDAYHHPREDAMFARLAKRDSSLLARIAEIKRAHRTIGAAGKKLLAALQRLEGNTRVDEGSVISLMNDYVKALREHMSIEERDLFQRAREVLDERDLEEIDRAFARVIDPSSRPRSRTLSLHTARWSGTLSNSPSSEGPLARSTPFIDPLRRSARSSSAERRRSRRARC